MAQYALAHIALAGGRADAAIQLHEDLELTYWLKEDASWRHVRDGYGIAEEESCCLLPLPPLDIHREVEDLAFRLAADHADILVSQAPVWKSTSELGYLSYCVDSEPPRRRADAATGTTSRRWRGAQNLISTQASSVVRRSRNRAGTRRGSVPRRSHGAERWVAHPAPLKLLGISTARTATKRACAARVRGRVGVVQSLVIKNAGGGPVARV